jgi:hypothetical protein
MPRRRIAHWRAAYQSLAALAAATEAESSTARRRWAALALDGRLPFRTRVLGLLGAAVPSAGA